MCARSSSHLLKADSVEMDLSERCPSKTPSFCLSFAGCLLASLALIFMVAPLTTWEYTILSGRNLDEEGLRKAFTACSAD